MSITRGFGMVFDIATGRMRSWYIGRDGVKRWAENDLPVDNDEQPEPTP